MNIREKIRSGKRFYSEQQDKKTWRILWSCLIAILSVYAVGYAVIIWIIMQLRG